MFYLLIMIASFQNLHPAALLLGVCAWFEAALPFIPH